MKSPTLQAIKRPKGRRNRSADVLPMRRYRKWKVWLVSGSVLLVIILLGWWTISTKFLTVKHVKVLYQVTVAPMVVPQDRVVKTAEQLKGAWIWQETSDMEQKLVADYPPIASVSTTVSWPDTVTMEVLPRVPLCQMVTPQGVYLLDRSGFIFARVESEQEFLPTIQADTRVEVGRQISSNSVSLGLQLINGLRSTQPSLQRLDLHDGQLDVHLDGPPLIYVGDDKSADEVLPQLEVLLKKFVDEDKYPKEVDMRYDRPVLRY